MKQSMWMKGAALLSAFALLSLATPGGAAYAPQGQQAFVYPKAFMLHRRAGGMPNLSVVGPLDVLRRKMMLDMMEQKMKNKINANNEFLSRLGKRAPSPSMLSPNSVGLTNLQQEWLGSLDSNEM